MAQCCVPFLLQSTAINLCCSNGCLRVCAQNQISRDRACCLLTYVMWWGEVKRSCEVFSLCLIMPKALCVPSREKSALLCLRDGYKICHQAQTQIKAQHCRCFVMEVVKLAGASHLRVGEQDVIAAGLCAKRCRVRGDRQVFAMGEGIAPLDTWRTASSASRNNFNMCRNIAWKHFTRGTIMLSHSYTSAVFANFFEKHSCVYNCLSDPVITEASTVAKICSFFCSKRYILHVWFGQEM